jgi:hypothetical protein
MIGARALIGAIAGILGGPWTIAGLIGVRLDQPPPGALIAARATIAVKDPDLREAAASSSGPRRVEHCPPIWGPAAAPAASSQGAATPPPPTLLGGGRDYRRRDICDVSRHALWDTERSLQ